MYGRFAVYLRADPVNDGVDAEKKLCVVVDVYSGVVRQAPTNAVYLYNEMDAACASIAERWPAIQPPAGAVL